MLPLLPFDGGHVSIAVYEAIRSRIKGRRHFADAGKLMPVAYVTVTALALISISSLYIDIARPLNLS
jgi:membrane-associated protease RseP (regulator of RpoE activity)